MTMQKMTHSGTLVSDPSQREIRHSQLARKMAAEGIVLLKNEDLLPFEKSARIALLGAGAIKTVKGGIGSGEVNNRENFSIYEGLKEAGIAVTSEEWLLDYCQRYDAAKQKWKEKILEDAKKVENPFDAYSANPFALPDGRTLQENDIQEAFAAVYVISRISGEGKDRSLVEGDYYLSKKEKEDLEFLYKKKIPLALIINAGGPVELTDVLAKMSNIKAVLNISQLGQQGGFAVADVLVGNTVPCGKLTATWAKHYEDYPYAKEFGYLNGNLESEEYREGIYVGYRYFDTFGVDTLFPFGYGLSYTSFAIDYDELRIKDKAIEIDVTVKNIGNSFAGKEVVQIYITLPQTGSAKEYHRLVGFAKTTVLKPQESQKLTITIEQKQIAEYAEDIQAWIIEQGIYGIWIGNHSASLTLAVALKVQDQVVLEQVKRICPQQNKVEELGASDVAKEKAAQCMAMIQEKNIPLYEFTPTKEEKKTNQMPSAEKQSIADLIPLLYGNITLGTSTLGSSGVRVPGSAGETTERLEDKYGIRSLIMADGPAGIRLRQSYEVDRETDSVYGVGVLGSVENGFLENIVHHENADTYYQYCTAFPVGTALAQTWDTELMHEFGEAIAAEMKEFKVDLWLAPGMNIHRNPLCGRNYEYYSEDPLLSGSLAAAVTAGVQSNKGCGVTIKHFACNNQEDNRMGVDVRVSEKALREIYFRGFEIAVKKSAPIAIMTSYNMINGVHSANNRDLCIVLAREEWGFDGFIMTDWNTTLPEGGSIPWKCVAAGNDMIMPGSPRDDENIREAYEKGSLSEKDIRACAGRIFAAMKKLGMDIQI